MADTVEALKPVRAQIPLLDADEFRRKTARIRLRLRLRTSSDRPNSGTVSNPPESGDVMLQCKKMLHCNNLTQLNFQVDTA